jgi:aminocarboxymuconate-semialdehyde decarboxylase
VIIDWHSHVYPPEEQVIPFWQGRCPMKVENVLEWMARCGIEKNCISNPYHELAYLDRAEQLRRVRRQNEYIAELVERYPDQLIGFATGVPCGGDEFVRETERAVRQLGLRGIIAMSSINGEYPDDDAALPFWQLVHALDVPVMIHPPAVAFGEERLKDYRLASSVGRPADNMLALARLIVRGIFERFPGLKLVGSHLGGGICEIIGRMDYAYELQDEAFFLGKYEPMLIKHKPSDYLRMMYLDCTSYHTPAVQCGIETVGADRVLFGTDAPPLTTLKPRGLQLVRDLPICAADKVKILGGNAQRLLKLH